MFALKAILFVNVVFNLAGAYNTRKEDLILGLVS